MDTEDLCAGCFNGGFGALLSEGGEKGIISKINWLVMNLFLIFSFRRGPLYFFVVGCII